MDKSHKHYNYGVFTLTETGTETDTYTAEMGIVPNGNQCRALSRYSKNACA